MRKTLMGFVLMLFAAVLIPGLALANPQQDNSNGPHKDYMWGAASVPLPTPFGSFSANITADGTTAPEGHAGVSGTFSTDFPATPIGPVSFSGNIVCINATRLTGTQNGNGGSSAANWRGVVTQSSTPAVPLGAGVLARTVDNGGGPANGDIPDTNIGFLTSPPGPTPTCPTTFAPLGAPITSGDLGVHDGGFDNNPPF